MRRRQDPGSVSAAETFLTWLHLGNAKITQIYEGTNQIQRMVLARQLLR